MASLSQALRLGDLPPPHRTFQGHATHIIEWSMMLRPNDSWGTCIPQGIATFLHYASRRGASWRYTTSQVAESHIDALINVRHKRTKKMQWTRAGAHHVLQIRAMMASDEWESKSQGAVLSALGAVA